MINFEHHEMLRNLAAAVEQIAKDHMRPFTREVDEQEHSNPE